MQKTRFSVPQSKNFPMSKWTFKRKASKLSEDNGEKEKIWKKTQVLLLCQKVKNYSFNIFKIIWYEFALKKR